MRWQPLDYLGMISGGNNLGGDHHLFGGPQRGRKDSFYGDRVPTYPCFREDTRAGYEVFWGPTTRVVGICHAFNDPSRSRTGAAGRGSEASKSTRYPMPSIARSP